MGPYNWNGPGWLAKHPPHIEQNRTNPPLRNWEGWGEGPRGKGRGKFTRPPDTTNARTEHRVGRGQRSTGPNLVTSLAVDLYSLTLKRGPHTYNRATKGRE